jgi:hypothetical protein
MRVSFEQAAKKRAETFSEALWDVGTPKVLAQELCGLASPEGCFSAAS